jgi:hypothetical protein
VNANQAGRHIAPGKFRFLRCPDIAARQDTAEARHKELPALMNAPVQHVRHVEAEPRALQQAAAIGWLMVDPTRRGK